MSHYQVVPDTPLSDLVESFSRLDDSSISNLKAHFPEVMDSVEKILSALNTEGVEDASGYDVAGTLAKFNTAIKHLTPSTSEYPIYDGNEYPMQNLNLFFQKETIDLISIRNHGSRAIIHMIAGTYGLDRMTFTNHLNMIGEGKKIDPKSHAPLDIAARAFAVIMDTTRSQIISKDEYNKLIAPIKKLAFF